MRRKILSHIPKPKDPTLFSLQLAKRSVEREPLQQECRDRRVRRLEAHVLTQLVPHDLWRPQACPPPIGQMSPAQSLCLFVGHAHRYRLRMH